MLLCFDWNSVPLKLEKYHAASFSFSLKRKCKNNNFLLFFKGVMCLVWRTIAWLWAVHRHMTSFKQWTVIHLNLFLLQLTVWKHFSFSINILLLLVISTFSGAAFFACGKSEQAHHFFFFLNIRKNIFWGNTKIIFMPKIKKKIHIFSLLAWNADYLSGCCDVAISV